MTDNLLRVIVDQRQQIQRDRIRFGNRLGAIERGADEGTEVQKDLAKKWEKLFKQLEKEMDKDVANLVRDHFFYPYLSSVVGVGPMLAAKIISQVDISRSPTRAALWRYAGYGVVDGKAERLVKGQKASFNKVLKTAVFQVGDSFIKHQTPYTDIYYNFKQRYQQMSEQKLKMALKDKARQDKGIQAEIAKLVVPVQAAFDTEDYKILEQLDILLDIAVDQKMTHTAKDIRKLQAIYQPPFASVWNSLTLPKQWAVITSFYDKYFWNGAPAWVSELEEALAGRSLPEAKQDQEFLVKWMELSKSKQKEVQDQFDNPNFWRPLESWVTEVKEAIAPWRKEVALYPPVRRHRMAMRKMVKLFLSHMWEVWRTVEGLDTRPPYSHEHLGHVTYYDPYDFGWPKFKHLNGNSK